MARSLNLSFCQIDSIEGLKHLPNIDTFIADGSHIMSLKNMAALSGIHKLSLKQTPVSAHSQYLLSCVMVCPELTSVNGRQVGAGIRSKVNSYPAIAGDLVNAGWMAEWPVPDDERFTELKAMFGVGNEIEDENSEPEAVEEVDMFEQVLDSYFQIHRKLVRAARTRMNIATEETGESESTEELAAEEESDLETSDTETALSDDLLMLDQKEGSLMEQLTDVLRDNGQEVDSRDQYNSVLTVIARLCEMRMRGGDDRSTEGNDE